MTDAAEKLRQWVESVASGEASMSQRGEAWVAQVGGIATVTAAAEAACIHLVRLTDDKGNRLIAASRERFETLC